MVIVPVREAPVVFAATLKLTQPSPVPLAPAVTVIHASLLDAVQEQLDPVMTETLPAVEPVIGAVELGGDRLYVH
jgi:hypothetical protein